MFDCYCIPHRSRSKRIPDELVSPKNATSAAPTDDDEGDVADDELDEKIVDKEGGKWGKEASDADTEPADEE